MGLSDFETPSSRMIFAGAGELADGFALIGFETLPNADLAQLDHLLHELLQRRQSAFVIIDAALAGSGSTELARVDAEGGRVVVAVVPGLAEPDQLHLDIDEQIRVLLGGQSLDE